MIALFIKEKILIQAFSNLFLLSTFQAQIDVEPYEYPIDPITLVLGGQVCLDFNVTVPCKSKYL
jgi:hypothetical protein